MTTETDMTIAETINAQIGGAAFFMMGTSFKTGGENYLFFNVKGCRDINRIKITLDASDTYTVTFYKSQRRTLVLEQVAESVGVYHDGLAQCIELQTGLRLSL